MNTQMNPVNDELIKALRGAVRQLGSVLCNLKPGSVGENETSETIMRCNMALASASHSQPSMEGERLREALEELNDATNYLLGKPISNRLREAKHAARVALFRASPSPEISDARKETK